MFQLARLVPLAGRAVTSGARLLGGAAKARPGVTKVAATAAVVDVAVLPAIENATDGRFRAPDVTRHVLEAGAEETAATAGAISSAFTRGAVQGTLDGLTGDGEGGFQRAFGVAPLVVALVAAGGALVLLRR